MKSPWRLIGNLFSRGHSADPEIGQKLDDAEATGRSGQTQESAAIASPAAELVPEPPANDVRPVSKTALEEAERDTGGKAVAGLIPFAEETRTPERSPLALSNTRAIPKRNEAGNEAVTRTKRFGRSKKTSTNAVAQRVNTPDSQEKHAINTQDDFQIDVETVDAEVQRLRRQLADALVIQNAQLKKMLERFGLS